MHNYKTVEEMATEWGVTPRHIQYLCRTGKITNAVKRAGSWFIPSDAASPAKNTKSDVKDFNFAGTKNRVFNSAIELFMSRGYNDVSLRDIAKDVGIQQSTIYNHFSSKQEILDTIYNFYCYYHQKDRPSLEYMEEFSKTASLLEMIECMSYDFEESYKQKMADITKIVFQRMAVDERAREITRTMIIEGGIEYVEDVLSKAVENGRFKPFDVHAMSAFINGVRVFTLFNWIVNPSIDNMTNAIKDASDLYNYAAMLITDLNTKD